MISIYQSPLLSGSRCHLPESNEQIISKKLGRRFSSKFWRKESNKNNSDGQSCRQPKCLHKPTSERMNKIGKAKICILKIGSTVFCGPLKNFSSLGLYWSTILNNIWRELPNAKVHQISISKPKLQWRGIEREIFEFKAEAFTAEPPRR